MDSAWKTIGVRCVLFRMYADTWQDTENAGFDKLMGEPYRRAIQGAIATWPSS